MATLDRLRGLLVAPLNEALRQPIASASSVRLAGSLTASIRTVSDGESRADVLELRDASGQVMFRFADTALDELAGELPIPPLALAQLLLSRQCTETGHPFVPPPSPVLQSTNARDRLREAAEYFPGRLRTQDVAGTCSGTYACAWAVNYVAQIATGSPVGGHLSTAAMHEALLAGASPWVSVTEPQVEPGDLVLSPTSGDLIGHVGLLGGNQNIYSNSSAAMEWRQNYTLTSWREKYSQRRLLVLYFRCTL